MKKEYLEIREIKSANEIEEYLKEHEEKYENVYFAFEDKYVKNAYLYVAGENETYSFLYHSMLGGYLEKLGTLEVYTREQMAEELFERVQKEY